MDRIPDLDEQLATADLEAAGWNVVPPEEQDDDYTWIRASKEFANVEEAEAIIAEVAGEDGWLRDVVITSDRSFGETTYSFTATADLSAGVDSLADPELVALFEASDDVWS